VPPAASCLNPKIARWRVSACRVSVAFVKEDVLEQIVDDYLQWKVRVPETRSAVLTLRVGFRYSCAVVRVLQGVG
jgi:hypothetical protein